ncbi:hypothetical protein GCM10009839_03550 [Catenulispora yoronensis]|uniref:HNH endonuclease n=1 Tax=Catenulispora yoronensis TaxID=450799 RepID=A0ABP5F0N1_9ACTN
MRTWTLRVCGTALAAALAVTQSGCQSKSTASGGKPRSRTTTHSAGATTAPGSTATPPAAGGSCHAGPGPLPDPTCTPGAINPQVTQANIATTICASGWTATIRPPVSFTNKLKTDGIKAYGYTNTALSGYEEDHLISLELGGAPSDPKNLWPEPGASPNAKDKVENDLNHAVCSGKVQLAAAQKAIATDWVTAEKTVGIGG